VRPPAPSSRPSLARRTPRVPCVWRSKSSPRSWMASFFPPRRTSIDWIWVLCAAKTDCRGVARAENRRQLRA
jgi:hypothetical protein